MLSELQEKDLSHSDDVQSISSPSITYELGILTSYSHCIRGSLSFPNLFGDIGSMRKLQGLEEVLGGCVADVVVIDGDLEVIREPEVGSTFVEKFNGSGRLVDFIERRVFGSSRDAFSKRHSVCVGCSTSWTCARRLG